MTDPIQTGEFLYDGDTYTLKLNPITNAVSIQSYTDVVYGEVGVSSFTREFRYSLDNGVSYTSWVALTNLALQGIVLSLSDKILMEIKYTRTDSSFSADVMRWEEFTLDNIQIEEHVVVRINKTVFDNLYGASKFLDILAALSKFNTSPDAQGVTVYIKDDNTLTGQAILIDNVMSNNSRDIDFNVLIKTNFGKKLIKLFTDLDVNPNNPRV